jgi:hypothetical protein
MWNKRNTIVKKNTIYYNSQNKYMLYNITIHRILPDFYFIYKFLQKFNFFFQVIKF